MRDPGYRVEKLDKFADSDVLADCDVHNVLANVGCNVPMLDDHDKRVIRETFRTMRSELPRLDIIVQVVAVPRQERGNPASAFDPNVLARALRHLFAGLAEESHT